MPNIKDEICGGDQFEALAAASQRGYACRGCASKLPLCSDYSNGVLRQYHVALDGGEVSHTASK